MPPPRSRFRVHAKTAAPRNVLETPKSASSVVINRTFGAPLGRTMRSGQYGVDCAASRSILLSNFCGDGGISWPPMVVVAQGEPEVPVICCALAVTTGNSSSAQPVRSHPGRAARTACFMSLNIARLHINETPSDAGDCTIAYAMNGVLQVTTASLLP